jgi:spore germination cell wall hydrolase CwlJ-like protein
LSAFFDIETPPEPKRPAGTERVRALWESLRAHPQHRLIASAAAALTVAAAAGGVTAALAGMDRHEPTPRRVVSDLSMNGFLNHIRGMDDAMLALAARFDQPGRFGAGAPPSPDPMAEILPTVLASASEESPVFRWQALSPDQARLINASLPVSTSPNPAARPFRLKADSAVESLRALDCLTAAVYYEAAKESDAGQQAVAQVVLNRMRHIAYPKTVCGVVFEGSQRTTGCQFSFTCDGSLNRKPDPAMWSRAAKAATAALNGAVMKGVGNATHYHANYVAPYWMPSLVKVATVGAHVFYRWEGGWGRPGAFNERYAGFEMDGMPNTDLAFLTPVKTEMLRTAEAAPPVPAPEAAETMQVVALETPDILEAPVVAMAPAPAAPVAVMADPFRAANAPRVNSRLAIPSGPGW